MFATLSIFSLAPDDRAFGYPMSVLRGALVVDGAGGKRR